MTAFIAFWPNSTISILSYPSGQEDETYEAWLYDDLDAEADPLDAKVFRLPPGFHVQTQLSIEEHDNTEEPRPCLSVTSFHLDGKRPKRLAWSPDASFKHWNRIRMQSRRRAAEESAEKCIAAYCSSDTQYPPVPPAAFSIDEIRAMDPFSGIYIAVESETGRVKYVGKSKDVTRRVSNSRPELKDCKLSIIKMHESDIHFAELHYIAKCRPYMNKEGGGKAGVHDGR